MKNINRGDIWLANLDPTVGSEISKKRPVLVVSNNINNANNNVVTVLPITSTVTRVFSFEVYIEAGEGNLPKNSKAKADQIRTLDKARLTSYVGSVSDNLMMQVDTALKLHLDLP